MEIPTPVCGLVRNDNVVRCLDFPRQIPIYCTIERYRAAQGRNVHTYLVHDLAARPAGKFLLVSVLTKADNDKPEI